MSLPQALKSQFTKSFHYHRENYPDEDYSTTFENCINNTELDEVCTKLFVFIGFLGSSVS